MFLEGFTIGDGIGLIGAAFLLLAYTGQLTGRWQASDTSYKWANLAGAGAIIVSVLFRPDPITFIVELLWACASLASLIWPGRPTPDRPTPDRRATRSAGAILDAAIRSIDALAAEAEKLKSLPATSPMFRTLLLELRGIWSTLEEGVIVPELGAPALAAVEQLFTAAGNTLQRAQSSENQATASNFLDELGALKRLLAAQRRTLEAPPAPSVQPMPAIAQAPIVAQAPIESLSESADIPIVKSAPGREGNSGEALLVAAAIDKLYGSAAFKIIGVALVAAALLAGAGTVYLGSHTLTLRADLEKAQEKGRKDIEQSKSDLQAAINKQSLAVTAMQTEIQDKKIDFNNRILEAKDQIRAITTDFESKSEDLKKQIIIGVVDRMADKLKNPVNEISEEFRKKAEAGNRQLDDLVTQTLDPLKKRAELIGGRLSNLSNETGRHEQELQKITLPLGRLREFAPDFEKIARDLDAMRLHQQEVAEAASNARRAVTEAVAQQRLAEQSASLTEKARSEILGAIGQLRSDTSGLERQLGYTQRNIELLNEQIREKAEKLPGSTVPPDLTPLSQRLDAFDKQLKAIEEKLKPQPQPLPLPQSQAELSQEQRIAIQRRLTALGRNTQGLDGDIGPNTRKAIREWQEFDLRQQATGVLTAAQIAQLLSPPQPARP